MKTKYAYAFSLAALAGCAKQETNINVLTAAQAGTDKPVVAVCEEFSDASVKNVSTMQGGSVMFQGRTVRGTADGEYMDGSNRSCTIASGKEMQVICSVGAHESYQRVATFRTHEFSMSAGREGVFGVSPAEAPVISYKTADGQVAKIWNPRKFTECSFH